MGYQIKNSAVFLESEGETHWWEWTAYLVPNGKDSLDEVNFVEYMLHPSFSNPYRQSHKKEKDFSITMKGWGTFVLRARIVFKEENREALSLSHHLVFEKT